MKVLMHALAVSCEELRARTGNPPLGDVKNIFCPVIANLYHDGGRGRLKSIIKMELGQNLT
jgi:hypothetical protein